MKSSRFIALFPAILLMMPVAGMAQSAPPSLFVPQGTVVMARTTDLLSSDRNNSGDSFVVTLDRPIVVDGWVVARTGQAVIGRVAAANKAGRAQGASRLSLELTEIVLVDGQQLPIRTQLIESHGPTSLVNDAGVIATGAGLGTIIGASVDGGTGAAIGAAIGGGAAITTVLSTRGRPTEIYPETLLTFRLEAPLGISTERSQQAFMLVSPSDYNRSQPALRIPARAQVQQPYYYPNRVYVRPEPVIVVPVYRGGGRVPHGPGGRRGR